MFCKGEACANLGTCYCMWADDYERIPLDQIKKNSNPEDPEITTKDEQSAKEAEKKDAADWKKFAAGN